MTVDELLSPANLEKVYAELQKSTSANLYADVQYERAKANQQSWFTQSMAEGIISGKNEAEREGNARILRPDLYEATLDRYSDMQQARAVMEMARIQERYTNRVVQLINITFAIRNLGGDSFDGFLGLNNIAIDGADVLDDAADGTFTEELGKAVWK